MFKFPTKDRNGSYDEASRHGDLTDDEDCPAEVLRQIFKCSRETATRAAANCVSHLLGRSSGVLQRLTAPRTVQNVLELLKSNQEPADGQQDSRYQLNLVNTAPIPGAERFEEVSKVSHDEGDPGNSEADPCQFSVASQSSKSRQEDTEITGQLGHIVPIRPILHHVGNSRDHAGHPGNDEHSVSRLYLTQSQERHTKPLSETAQKLGAICEIGAIVDDVLDGLLDLVPPVQKQAKTDNGKGEIIGQILTGQPFQVLDGFRKGRRHLPKTDGGADGPYGVQNLPHVVFEPCDERLHLLLDLLDLLIGSVTKEVILG